MNYCELRMTRIIALCGLLASAISSSFAQEIAIDDALSVIKKAEDSIQTIEYHSQIATGVFENADPPLIFAKTNPTHTSSHVRWDFTNHRYFAHLDSVQAATSPGTVDDGKDSFFSVQREYSNDSVAFRCWHRGRFADTPTAIPDSNEGTHQANRRGIISSAQEESVRYQGRGFVEVRCMDVGLGWVPPFIWSQAEPPLKLSEYITNKHDDGDVVSITSVDGGLWLIYFAIKKASQHEWKLYYDPEHRRPVRAEFGFTKPDPEKTWHVNTRLLYEYTSSADLVPNRVALVDLPIGGNNRCYEWKYSDVKINPKFETSAFELTFPNGIEVTDYISGGVFVSGTSTANDEKSVHRFMEAEGLLPAEKAKPPKSSTNVMTIIIVNIVVLALIAAFMFRKSRHAATCIVACLYFANTSAAGEMGPQNSQTPQIENNVHITQCGFLATVFTLKYFHIDYSRPVLESALKPTRDGIVLANIVDLLTAYGLDINVRDGVRLNEIKSVVNRGFVGLMPIKFRNGRGHYILVISHPQNKKIVVVDVLNEVGMIEESLNEGLLSSNGGTVAFIAPAARRQPVQNSEIAFAPDVLDIGNIELGEKSIRRAVMHLENRSKRPVIITKIETSCGCATAKWKEGLLTPNSRQEITFEVATAGWASGQQRKNVKATSYDGPTADGAILGTGIDAQHLQGLSAKNSRVEIDLTEQYLSNSQTVVRADAFAFTGSSDRLRHLEITCSDRWVSFEKVDMIGGLGVSFAPLIQMTEDTKKALTRGRAVVRINAKTVETEKPVELTLVVTRRPLVKMDAPNEVLAGLTEAAYLEISDAANIPCENMEINSIKSIPAGLEFFPAQFKDGRIQIQMKWPKQTKPQQFLVRCDVERSNPKSIDSVGTIVRIDADRSE